MAPTAIKSGCVLNMANWRVLETEKLVSASDIKDCKMAFNTFAFTGERLPALARSALPSPCPPPVALPPPC